MNDEQEEVVATKRNQLSKKVIPKHPKQNSS